MDVQRLIVGSVTFVAVAALCAVAEKELMYDPVQGIIFVEKKDSAPGGGANPADLSPAGHVRKLKAPAPSSGLHVGRKKDPPELYFKSGLEYFKNEDYNNALKNFTYADSLEHHSEYMLFIGKTLRNLGKKSEMIKVMFDVLKDDPDGEVADDALLELALHYKADDDYEKSIQLFTRLIEQYPFGTEYSTGEELPVLAREQRRIMRAEMINLLTTLGFGGEDLQSGFLKFQKAHNLLQSGVGDRETVTALKAAQREYLEHEDVKAAKLQQIDELRGWVYAAIAAGLINCVLLMVLLIKGQAYRKHVAELRTIISELEPKNI